MNVIPVGEAFFEGVLQGFQKTQGLSCRRTFFGCGESRDGSGSPKAGFVVFHTSLPNRRISVKSIG